MEVLFYWSQVSLKGTQKESGSEVLLEEEQIEERLMGLLVLYCRILLRNSIEHYRGVYNKCYDIFKTLISVDALSLVC